MMPALRNYALLWSTATASRDPRARWMFGAVALGLMLAVGVLVWSRTGALFETLGYTARVPVAVFLFAALTYYMPGAILLNTPANARLVPHMRRRLVRLTVCVWAASTAAAALLGWDTAAPAALIACAAFAWLIGLGLGSAGYQLGGVLQGAVPCLVVGRDYLPEVLFQQPFVAGICLLLLALAARTLDLMFPNGGDRHWERRHAQLRVIERTRPEGMMRQASRARFAGALYAAALRRNSTARRAPAFVLPMLGPALHWTQRYLPLLAIAAVAVVLIVVLKFTGNEAQFARKWLALLCLGMLFAQLFTYGQRGQRLADTATEQSLLRMAPPILAAPLPFNRQLNGSLLRMALLDWSAIVATLLAVSAFAGSTRADLVVLAQLCCLTLPLVGANLRNHARGSGLTILPMVGALVASVACSFGASLLLRHLVNTPLIPVAALVSVVLAAGVVAWRWRAAIAAPHAFPTGRLAS
jgi:hypothetical protein